MPEITLDNLTLITIAAFAVLTLATFVVAGAIVRLRQDPVRERLEAIARVESPAAEAPPSPLVESLAAQIPIARLDNGALNRELRQAGYYSPTARRDYLAIRNGLIIGAVLMTGVIAVAIGPQRQDWVIRVLIAGGIATLLAWAVPRLLLRNVATRRVRRIRNALPYALDMITMCLAGGISLREALSHVSREIVGAHPDLAVELIIVRQQAEFNSLEFALHQFAARIDSPEITGVSSLVAHTHRLGVSAAAAMQEYADLMRQKWRQEAEERANATSVRLLFPIALFLLPSAMLLLWGPAAVDLYRFLTTGTRSLRNTTVPVPQILPRVIEEE